MRRGCHLNRLAVRPRDYKPMRLENEGNKDTIFFTLGFGLALGCDRQTERDGALALPDLSPFGLPSGISRQRAGLDAALVALRQRE